jgi:hypothetical protein
MHNIDWRSVLTGIAADVSTELNLNIIVENYILVEIADRIHISLEYMGIARPNVAKIAGVVAFWVRKLKPFSYAPDETAKSGKFHALNELIGIQAGLAICNSYKDDYSREEFRLSSRLLIDWLHSLRFHSHSPHSSLLAFELLTTAT